MFLFYVDESGSLDCRVDDERGAVPGSYRDHIYVLTAVSLFDAKWQGFEATLNSKKRELNTRIVGRGGTKLELADCELKSNAVRRPKMRQAHPFLGQLYDPEVTEIVDLFYRQLDYHRMRIFSVVVDKRHLHSYMNPARLHRKAWELLLERIHFFLRSEHPKHRGIMIVDDIGKQQNRSLAMKHAYLLWRGTSASQRLSSIVGMPLFTASELSNGIQLADLVAYNFYRAFKCEDFDYEFFRKVVPYIWRQKRVHAGPPDGLKVFPNESPLVAYRDPIGSLMNELSHWRDEP